MKTPEWSLQACPAMVDFQIEFTAISSMGTQQPGVVTTLMAEPIVDVSQGLCRRAPSPRQKDFHADMPVVLER